MGTTTHRTIHVLRTTITLPAIGKAREERARQVASIILSGPIATATPHKQNRHHHRSIFHLLYKSVTVLSSMV